MLKSSGEKYVAAIASKRAAEIYDMEILEANIEDNPENFTRFLEISTEPAASIRDGKTSIVFSLNHKPGQLLRALEIFATRNINLTKIESRPLVGKPCEYLFYLDLISDEESGNIQNALPCSFPR